MMLKGLKNLYNIYQSMGTRLRWWGQVGFAGLESGGAWILVPRWHKERQVRPVCQWELKSCKKSEASKGSSFSHSTEKQHGNLS